jgi:hypothetical protein
MTAPTLAPPETTAWVTGLTRADKHALIEGMSPNALRAILRHCLDYAPEALDRAIAERLCISEATAARKRAADAEDAERRRLLAAATAERTGKTS